MEKSCLICLNKEGTTRLFSLQAAQNEDGQRYEQLTGLKVRGIAHICQRCSIDLGMAVTLKQKAIESSKHFALKNSAKAPMIKAQQVAPSNSKTLQLNGNVLDSNTQTQSQASIISSKIVVPPLNMKDISTLFKSNPNVKIIKKITGTANNSPAEGNKKATVAKVPTNEGSKIKQRRYSVCVDKYNANQNQKEAAQKTLKDFTFTSFSKPTKIVEKRSLPLEEETQKKKPKASLVADNLDEMSPNSSGKAGKEKGIKAANEQKRYNTRQKNEPKPQEITSIQYWINSTVKGYHIETFKNHQEAKDCLNNLPEGSTFGLLVEM